MPELPEVEVTRRLIEPLLIGRAIQQVAVTRASYFFLTPPKELQRRLLGQTVKALDRRGKYLLADLGEGARLLLHLGMTGQLFSTAAESPRLLLKTARAALTPDQQVRFVADQHTHLTLHFADGGVAVHFRDVRKFGKVLYLPAGTSDKRLDRLGPDALGIEDRLLRTAGSRRRGPVKGMLLDQSVLAGVGNIYADEALFRARVSPVRSACRVRPKEWTAIAEAVRYVLNRGIETGGSSISDFVRPDGKDGGFQDERQVYARQGEPCFGCGEPLAHLTVAGRSTTHCARCQR